MVNKGLEDIWNSQCAVTLTSPTSSSPVNVFPCLSRSAKIQVMYYCIYVSLSCPRTDFKKVRRDFDNTFGISSSNREVNELLTINPKVYIYSNFQHNTKSLVFTRDSGQQV